MFAALYRVKVKEVLRKVFEASDVPVEDGDEFRQVDRKSVV
jgi:hypothetical protein